jgi:hypothetical protein
MKIKPAKLLEGLFGAAMLCMAKREKIDGAVRNVGRILGTNKPPKAR